MEIKIRKQNQAKSSLITWKDAFRDKLMMMKMIFRKNMAVRTIVILGNKNTINIMNLVHDNILSSWPTENPGFEQSFHQSHLVLFGMWYIVLLSFLSYTGASWVS